MAEANSNRNKSALASGIIGIILLLFAFALAIISGIAMCVSYFVVCGAGVLTVIAGVVLFVALILAIIATSTNNANLAFATAIMSILSSTTIACCLGVPFGYKRIYIMPVIAVFLSFFAFLLFMYFYIKTPAWKKFIKSGQFKYEYNELQNAIQNELNALKDKLADGTIAEKEYEEKAQALLSRMDVYTETSRQMSENVSASKKQTGMAFIIPIAVMCVMYVVLIPSVHFGVCKNAYAGLIREMSDMDMWFCGCHTAFNTYNGLLPDNYKDVAEIRREMNEYEVITCIEALHEYHASTESAQQQSARARVAYKRLMELREVDPRWGFDSVIYNCKALYSNANWQGEGMYFDIAYAYAEGALATNLPCPIAAEDMDEYKYMSLRYIDGVIKVYFSKTNNWIDLSLRLAFELSELRYDAEKNEFSIDIYCSKTDETYTLTFVDEHIWSDFKW